MFRLQNNVPDVYVQESRDFQLFCRLFDGVFGGVKFGADSLLKATNTSKCPEHLLDLLCLKLGIFTDLSYLSNDQLRILLSCFPTIIRYKGSIKALKYCGYMILRMSGTVNKDCAVNIINKDSNGNKVYTIQITFEKKEPLNNLFIDLFKLIAPAGYVIELVIASEIPLTEENYLEELLIPNETESAKVVSDKNSQIYAQVGLAYIGEPPTNNIGESE